MTLYGLLWKLAVSAWMAVTWLQRTTIVSFILWRTWDPARSRTWQFCTPARFLKTSRSMQLRFPLTHLPSSMRTMMLWSLSGAMTTASAAAYPLLRPVRKSSSSALVQTWLSAYCTRSTVVRMRSIWTRTANICSVVRKSLLLLPSTLISMKLCINMISCLTGVHLCM